MNSIPTGRRRQALLVLIGTAAVLAGLWFTLIDSQYRGLAKLGSEISAAELESEKVRKALGLADDLEARLAEVTDRLRVIEDDMASGDLYSSVVNLIRDFKVTQDVNIPQIGQPIEKDTTLLPKFPYRQVSVNVMGTAHYHDLGRFVAEFENQHPYSRIQNLEMEPAAAASGAEREKLTFRMDIVTLVRPVF